MQKDIEKDSALTKGRLSASNAQHMFIDCPARMKSKCHPIRDRLLLSLEHGANGGLTSYWKCSHGKFLTAALNIVTDTKPLPAS